MVLAIASSQRTSTRAGPASAGRSALRSRRRSCWAPERVLSSRSTSLAAGRWKSIATAVEAVVDRRPGDPCFGSGAEACPRPRRRRPDAEVGALPDGLLAISEKSRTVYKLNSGPRQGAQYDLDRDNDGVACEKK